jgi:hypothetical protein
MTSLIFQGPIEALAKRDGARRTHPFCLIERGGNRVLDLLIPFITIQVIFP